MRSRWVGPVVVIATLCAVLPASAAAAAWHATSPQQRFPGFEGVGASSTLNVWAVGENDADRETPYAARWNGAGWIEDDPAMPAGSLPNGGVVGVSALSTANAWTVGWTDRGTNNQSIWPLIDHWNGKTWTVMSAPSLAGSSLDDVSAITTSNVWAVGGTTTGALIEHWNGKAWKAVAAPGSASLGSIRTVTASNIWAVGGDQIEHYNGKNWTLASYPAPQPTSR